MMSGPLTLIYALAGGIIPALLWLAFWMHEDKTHPEPRLRIIKVFLAGMISVPIIFFVQWRLAPLLLDGVSIKNLYSAPFETALVFIVVLAGIEEIGKYLAARFSALKSKDNDEAVDPVIYMIVASLGFAAMENGMYLITPILSDGAMSPFIESNMRFVGATLVHVACSAIVGMAISFTMFTWRRYRALATIYGIIFATGLHAIYNLFIITNENYRMIAFILIWSVCITLIVLFEKIKKIHLNSVIPQKPHEKA